MTRWYCWRRRCRCRRRQRKKSFSTSCLYRSLIFQVCLFTREELLRASLIVTCCCIVVLFLGGTAWLFCHCRLPKRKCLLLVAVGSIPRDGMRKKLYPCRGRIEKFRRAKSKKKTNPHGSLFPLNPRENLFMDIRINNRVRTARIIKQIIISTILHNFLLNKILSKHWI